MLPFRFSFIIIFFLSFLTVFPQDKGENIVIVEYENLFQLISSKSSDRVTQIKQTIKYTYKANRAPGVAYAIAPYDIDTKIVKAKAKGSVPIYEASINNYLLYDDSHLCILPIELKKVGEEVTATFELIHEKPEHEPFIYLGSSYPIDNAIISFLIPSKFKNDYSVALDNMPDNYELEETTTKDDNLLVTLKAQKLPALKLPEDAPSGRFCFPSVQLLGWFKDTNDIYKYLHKLASNNEDNSEAVVSLTKQIIANATCETDKIQKIYDWVHTNIRYIAIEHGDFGFIPDNASSVINKRYADCKGSANLLKELLKAAEFDSRLVWIGTDAIPYDWTERPTLSTGNHMIAAVVFPNDSILYLDGTVGAADYNSYSTSIQGKQTIIENGETCLIDRVPFQSPSFHVDSIEIDLSIDESNLDGHFKRTIYGNNKSAYLNAITLNKSNKEKIIENSIIQKRNNWSADSIILYNDSPGNGPIKITSNLHISNAIVRSGDKSYLSFTSFPELELFTFNTKDRTTDGKWNAPRSLVRTVNVNIPDASKIDLPQDLKICNQYFDASINYNKKHKCIQVKFRFDFLKPIIKNSDLEQLNEQIKQFSKSSNLKLLISNINN